MNDAPMKETMNIYLLNIPFAIVGVAIVIVPLLIGMKHQARNQLIDAVDAVVQESTNDHPIAEYENAS